jgi:acetoin utilization deacetylase AcuC-like enzyme
VLFFSIHKGKFYPNTGHIKEVGDKEGKGYTINVPYYDHDEMKTFTDTDFLMALDEILVPVLNDFKPELILVSAGFDAAHKDPLADFSVNNKIKIVVTRGVFSHDRVVEGVL